MNVNVDEKLAKIVEHMKTLMEVIQNVWDKSRHILLFNRSKLINNFVSILLPISQKNIP